MSIQEQEKPHQNKDLVQEYSLQNNQETKDKQENNKTLQNDFIQKNCNFPQTNSQNIFVSYQCQPHSRQNYQIENIIPMNNFMEISPYGNIQQFYPKKLASKIIINSPDKEKEKDKEKEQNELNESNDSKDSKDSNAQNIQNESREQNTENSQSAQINSINQLNEVQNIPQNINLAFPQNIQIKKTSCNCRRSKCLKLYCSCFANGEFCKDCNCQDCANIPGNEDEINKQLKEISDKSIEKINIVPKLNQLSQQNNPIQPLPVRQSTLLPTNLPTSIVLNNSNFQPYNSPASTHIGCNCTKSNCVKKYCECYKNGVPCTEACRCRDCDNMQCGHNKKENSQPLNLNSPIMNNTLNSLNTLNFKNDNGLPLFNKSFCSSSNHNSHNNSRHNINLKSLNSFSSANSNALNAVNKVRVKHDKFMIEKISIAICNKNMEIEKIKNIDDIDMLNESLKNRKNYLMKKSFNSFESLSNYSHSNSNKSSGFNNNTNYNNLHYNQFSQFNSTCSNDKNLLMNYSIFNHSNSNNFIYDKANMTNPNNGNGNFYSFNNNSNKIININNNNNIINNINNNQYYFNNTIYKYPSLNSSGCISPISQNKVIGEMFNSKKDSFEISKNIISNTTERSNIQKAKEILLGRKRNNDLYLIPPQNNIRKYNDDEKEGEFDELSDELNERENE